MAFTEDEKGRIRHFLSYPSWASISNSIQLGFPSGSQPLFLLEQAFNRLLPAGEESVRADLCQCEAIEQQLGDARRRFKAEALGELKLQPKETSMLRNELDYWSTRLADDLGVVKDPYSQAAHQGMAGGINARVQG